MDPLMQKIQQLKEALQMSEQVSTPTTDNPNGVTYQQGITGTDRTNLKREYVKCLLLLPNAPAVETAPIG